MNEYIKSYKSKGIEDLELKLIPRAHERLIEKQNQHTHLQKLLKINEPNFVKDLRN